MATLKRRTLSGASIALYTMAGCSPAVLAGAPLPPSALEQLTRLEQRYADARDLFAQIHITEARGALRTSRGLSLRELRRSYEIARSRLLDTLRHVDSARLADADRRALRTMRTVLTEDTLDLGGSADSAYRAVPACSYAADSLGAGVPGSDAFEHLSERIYDCYGRAARRVAFGRDTVDRLTVLGRLATMEDAGERRALFLSLEPLWEAMNGRNEPSSPYRTLVRLSAAEWRKHGSYADEQARSLGLEPSRVEEMLLEILEAWRDRAPAQPVEPWDWWYQAGAASRRLSPRVTRDALRQVNDHFYRDLGADPGSLGIRYDLDARNGKTPVAFTDFGSHPRRESRGWAHAEPWVFATYADGGIDNLSELLHETGHAVHIAAIETRPAFADWPDSDPVTEALGDLIALDVSEPSWQRKYLGDSVTTADAMRGRYGGIVMDVAWALFELRMHDDPARDPNGVWTDITSTYLHVTPHPEWSWWGMRGQLVDVPGYMLNYALGAVVSADLRARVKAERGPFWRGDKRMYAWLSERLYRFGLERPTRDVLRDFLGRPLSVEPLLEDMQRLGS
jgi:hypothetical protein